MTNIQSPMPTPVAPDKPWGGQGGSQLPQSDLDFAALLTQATDSELTDPRFAIGADGRPNPALAVAHVFNEFGFFSAAAANSERRPSGPTEPVDLVVQRNNAPSESRENADEVIMSATARADAEVAIQPDRRQPQCDAQGQHSLSMGASLVQLGQPTDDDRRVSLPTLDWVRGLVGGIEHRSPLPESPRLSSPSAEQVRPRSSAQVSGEPMQEHVAIEHDSPVRGSSGPIPDPTQDPHERMVFRIDGHMVELVGRLQGLGEDEKQRLVDALNEVLESHGLSLGSATLNGKPLALSLAGGAS